MKKVFLSLLLSMSLSACSTMNFNSAFDGFNWSDLNPFSEREPVQSVEIGLENNRPNPPKDDVGETALTTEMNELAMVRGESGDRIPVEDVLNGHVKRSEDGKDIVTIANIQDAEPAAAAPKTEVKSTPTKDSIQWEGASAGDTILNMDSGECSSIKLAPDADRMTKFDDEAMEIKTAMATITDIDVECEAKDGGMNMNITMQMDGQVTDTGRFEGNRDLEAFITFPYFISARTPNGESLDKKIEATAMKFQPNIDMLDHSVTATYFISMADISKATQYDVIVGFQLNNRELDYNRAQKDMANRNARIAPAIKPSR